MKKIIFILAIIVSSSAFASPSQLTLPNPMVHTGNAPSALAIGTASAQIFAQNFNRTGLLCEDTGTVSVSLSYGASAAVVGGGITIPAGGSWKMDDYSFSTQAINAIASAAGTLSCLELQ